MALIRYVLAGLLAAGTARAAPPMLSEVEGHNDVALMFSPPSDDPRFTQETSELATLTTQPAFQSVVVVGVADGTVIGLSDNPSALRARFGVPANAFRFVLLGKIGQVSLSQGSVVTRDRIAQMMQAMPPP
jgi:hypothetical protein